MADSSKKREREKRYRDSNPDREREKHLKKNYGISLAVYDAMWDAQDGVCAICKRPETAVNPNTGSPRRLAVDHCHTTGMIRGLLCTNCNGAIGKLRDDIALFESAIDYLTKAEACASANIEEE